MVAIDGWVTRLGPGGPGSGGRCPKPSRWSLLRNRYTRWRTHSPQRQLARHSRVGSTLLLGCKRRAELSARVINTSAHYVGWSRAHIVLDRILFLS